MAGYHRPQTGLPNNFTCGSFGLFDGPRVLSLVRKNAAHSAAMI
jgi:hypothetical protein